MADHQDAPAEQIIIIRRRGGEAEDGHHGGAWKIAYADFMTAMMALFLVMWLINASNTETRASVAAYFSPIKLTDSVSRTKGMQDVVDRANQKGLTKSGGEEQVAAPNSEPDKKRSADKTKAEGAQGALDRPTEDKLRLALTPDYAAPALKREDSAARSAGASEPGRAFRDPFQPIMPAPMADVSKKILENGRSLPTAVTPPSASTEPARPAVEKNDTAGSNEQAKPKIDGARVAQSTALQENVENKKLLKAADQILRSVQSAARQLGTTGGPAIDVQVEGETIVLSLTDTNTFGMFGIGSSEPNVDLIRLMQTIAPIVTADGERITVRGHTDGRQYRTDRNNNWRLSMSRAEAALAMLVRSGVDESRFDRIEAHADRNLKVPKDPDASGNRRIEIVLRQAVR